MKKQVIRAAATSVLGLSLMTGFAAADINTTGPGSDNTQHTTIRNTRTVRNDNFVRLNNSNYQTASSGDAKVFYNTEGGDAASGYATNHNSTSASVNVNNTASSGGGSWGSATFPTGGSAGNITLTGPNSENRTSFRSTNEVNIQNTNNVDITNTNNQSAKTGDASVTYNTIGGSAVSGDATNTNSSSFNVSVSN